MKIGIFNIWSSFLLPIWRGSRVSHAIHWLVHVRSYGDYLGLSRFHTLVNVNIISLFLNVFSLCLMSASSGSDSPLTRKDLLSSIALWSTLLDSYNSLFSGCLSYLSYQGKLPHNFKNRPLRTLPYSPYTIYVDCGRKSRYYGGSYCF